MIRGLVSYADNPRLTADPDGAAASGENGEFSVEGRNEDGGANGTASVVATEPSSSSSNSFFSPQAPAFVPSAQSSSSAPPPPGKNKKRKEKVVLFSASSPSRPPNRRRPANDLSAAVESDLREQVARLEVQVADANTQRDHLRGQRDGLRSERNGLASEVERLQAGETKAFLERQELQGRIAELEALETDRDAGRGPRQTAFSHDCALDTPTPSLANLSPPSSLPQRPRSDLGFHHDRADHLAVRNRTLEEQLQAEQACRADLSTRVDDLVEERDLLQQQLASADGAIRELEEEAARQDEAHAAAQEGWCAEMQRTAMERKRQASRVWALEGEAELAKKEAEQARKAEDQARREAEASKAELKRKEKWCELYKRERSDLEVKVQSLEADLDDLRSQLSSPEAINSSLHQQNERLASVNADLAAQIATLKAQVEELKPKKDELSEALALMEELSIEQDEAVRKREGAEGEAAALRARLEKAERESLLHTFTALPYRTAAWTARLLVDLNLRILRWGIKRIAG
ncbi:hypothetical protein JCM6882_002212 [Rhodosporidiobolus microsporus]